MAVASTVMVIALFAAAGAWRALEGIAAYALAGALVWWVARRTMR